MEKPMSVYYRSQSYRFKVGTITLHELYDDKVNHEVAAWSTTLTVAPGTYPVYGRMDRGELRLSTDVLPAIVTENHTPALFGGVRIGSSNDGSEDIGTERATVVPVTHGLVKSGIMDFEIEAGFLEVTPDDSFQQYRVNPDHPEWLEVEKDRELFEFKHRLFTPGGSLRPYPEDNGFLTGQKLKEGLELGQGKYEDVIRSDQALRRKTGHGFEHFEIPLTTVSEMSEAEISKQKRGYSPDNIASAVATKIIKDFEIPPRVGARSFDSTPDM